MEAVTTELNGTKYLMMDVLVTGSRQRYIERKINKLGAISKGWKSVNDGGWFGVAHGILMVLVPENKIEEWNNYREEEAKPVEKPKAAARPKAPKRKIHPPVKMEFHSSLCRTYNKTIMWHFWFTPSVGIGDNGPCPGVVVLASWLFWTIQITIPGKDYYNEEIESIIKKATHASPNLSR